jgi:hypothetical protein
VCNRITHWAGGKAEAVTSGLEVERDIVDRSVAETDVGVGSQVRSIPILQRRALHRPAVPIAPRVLWRVAQAAALRAFHEIGATVPFLWPGTARSAASAGRWLIMISGEMKASPRPRVRALGIRNAPGAQADRQFAAQRASTLKARAFSG